MRILIIYYSQTGQMRKILEGMFSQAMAQGVVADFHEIVADPPFPFPWTSDQFFDAFPESFMGIPCKLKPLDVSSADPYDLVVLGYSPWYLSPSIPIHSFLQSDQAKSLLKGKNVVTVIGSRNMWLQAQEKIKKYLKSLDANLVGNVALYDKAPNLVSVLTIIRWLIKGRQERGKFFPRAGVSEADIRDSARYGDLIIGALTDKDIDGLQAKLVSAGAVNIKPNLVLFERNGSKIFRMWSSKILKKGPHGDPRRRSAHRFFKVYLLVVLFVVSPLANVVYFFIKWFIGNKIRRDKQYFSQNGLAENV